MTGYLASSFTVSGVHGFLLLLAFLLFATAAIVSWVLAPRAVWGTFVAAGLALATLAMLFTGLPPSNRPFTAITGAYAVPTPQEGNCSRLQGTPASARMLQTV